MDTDRAHLLRTIESASSEVERTEAALDEAERGVRDCPHVFACFDRDPGTYDAAGMREEASEAITALAKVQASLADVLAGSGARPDFEQAKATFVSLGAILATLPSAAAFERYEEAVADLQDARGALEALESELADVMGGARVDTAALTRAAHGLHALRAGYALSTLPEAEAALVALLGERDSLSALRATWGAALDGLGLNDHQAVDPEAFVLAAEQVVFLGTEALMSYRRLPATARATLADFGARCAAAKSERDSISAEFGPTWLGHSALRLRRASEILTREDDPKAGLALELADQVGAFEGAPAALSRMAAASEALAALADDVAAARILGVKFKGQDTDVAAETESFDRWLWLVENDEGRPEYAAVAGAVLDGRLGDVLELEGRLLELLAATAAHEASYGSDWYGHRVDEDHMRDLAGHITAVRAVGLRGADAFERAFQAFVLATEVERARAVVSDASFRTMPSLSDARERLSRECRDFLSAMYPDAAFDATLDDLPYLKASVASGRAALADFVACVRRINGFADYPVVDLTASVAEASERVPLLLDSGRIAIARMGWSAAHEALDVARAALDRLDAERAEAEARSKGREEAEAKAALATAMARDDVEAILLAPVVPDGGTLGCLAALPRLRETAPELVPLPTFKAPKLVSLSSAAASVGGSVVAMPKKEAPTQWGSKFGKQQPAARIPDVAIAAARVDDDWLEVHVSKVQDANSRLRASAG